jgi:hypothetical protein
MRATSFASASLVRGPVAMMTIPSLREFRNFGAFHRNSRMPGNRARNPLGEDFAVYRQRVAARYPGLLRDPHGERIQLAQFLL